MATGVFRPLGIGLANGLSQPAIDPQPKRLVHVAVEKPGAADVRITGSFCG